MWAQPGFGVVVMLPQVGDDRRTSIGPNEPTPTAASPSARVKKPAARPIVSAGVVVGNVTVSRRLPGPSPIAHTHFVPPASMPP